MICKLYKSESSYVNAEIEDRAFPSGVEAFYTFVSRYCWNYPIVRRTWSNSSYITWSNSFAYISFFFTPFFFILFAYPRPSKFSRDPSIVLRCSGSPRIGIPSMATQLSDLIRSSINLFNRLSFNQFEKSSKRIENPWVIV